MEIRPVRHYAAPPYPTRARIDAHPDLLRAVPRRWQGKPLALAALAGACALLSGGALAAADKKGQTQKITASLVAPVFIHGEGRGALGCSAVNPPIFLSEGEARQVIAEEARRAGFNFTTATLSLKNIEVPKTARPQVVDVGGKKESVFATQQRTLMPDGEDTKRGVSYLFVSQKDYEEWTTPTLSFGTVKVYEVRGVTEALRKGIEEKEPTGAVAVFYDPLIGWRDAYKAIQDGPSAGKADYSTNGITAIKAKATELAREELRLQVRDFIGWLRDQGII